MSETIGEIQDRLRPDHLLQQAKDGVREAATGKVKNIMNSASETAYDAAQRARGDRQPPRVVRQGTSDSHRDHGRRDRVVDAARPQQRSEQWYGASDTSWDYDEYGPIEPTLRDRVSERRLDARSRRRRVRVVGARDGRRIRRQRARHGQRIRRSRRRRRRKARRAASAAPPARRRRRSTTGCTRIRSRPAPSRWRSARPSASRCRATEYEDRAMGETRDQALAKARHVANNLKTERDATRSPTYAEDVVGESLRAMRPPQPPMGQA